MLAEPMPLQDEILLRIRGEFLEMPGLSLTPAQAQRLWALEREVCDGLLTALVTEGFLARRSDGVFLRRTRSSVR